MDKFLKDWRDDAVFIYPGATPVSGEHKGKGSVRRWWMTFYYYSGLLAPHTLIRHSGMI
jgi:hypothetical protein